MALVQIQSDIFRHVFPNKGFLVRHNLIDSELFQLPRLVELAGSLPTSSIEHNLGNVSVSQDQFNTKKNSLSVPDTIMQIEDCKTWMVLKNVEQDLTYRALLETCLADVEPFSLPVVGEISMIEAFVFISSPDSVTPFHFDPEHNFLLQIRGQKTLNLFDRWDRELLPESLIEDSYLENTHRNMDFDKSDQRKAEEYLLSPGEGLYVPQNAPHWVKNGHEVSISFSITFRSRESERLARLYALNGKLRRKGFNPSAVMSSPIRDLAKDTLYRAYRKSQNLLKGI